ncbi:MAG TPA: CarD family transcriptional regulator [Clostridiales bacterium]|nr:CarD family transcriptional regulator [Clostridiales bacterium]
MFEIGDKIVYPLHGAGEIEKIEEKEILGEVKEYYILKMPFGDMKVMIPTANSSEIGIRGIISKKQAYDVVDFFSPKKLDDNSNWNKRYRENMDRLKTGDIEEVADVVNCLMMREKEKGLSTGERKMLCSAKKILYSELILAAGFDADELEDTIKHKLYDDVQC